MLLNVFIITSVLTVPALIQLIKVWGDMLQIIDNLQYTLPFLVIELKIFVIWYKRRVLSLLINMIVKDWLEVKIDQERNVMLKKARITRLLVKSGIFILVFAELSRISSPFFRQYFEHTKNLTNPEGSFPIPTYYWYDVTSSPKYELTYLAQIIGMTAGGLTYVVVDNFLGLLILHVCGQMENLHLRLMNLGKDSDFRTVLKYNVKEHIRLIRSVEAIDSTFNLLLLTMIGFFSIFFSLQGFLIINAVNRDSNLSITQLASYISASVSVLMNTCLYCAAGELLVIQNEKIHSATWECIWYTLEPKATRNLTLIMLCAKKPLNITAGKMFPMTMSTYCNLLKTSAGYMSMLLALRN
ncbi:odorant receptor 67d-like [Solenopsis invicta]|uniref:odorant receptor 67d-like n=1 Tax=Solenopsis invicta TaxID=13686 RepID=UPI00193E7C3B|nr:odorant receptor 67d-like [Solenopsis invicta]